MSLGPIEVVVIAFPGNQFNGRILPELGRLLDAGTISIVDGVLLTKDAAGTTTFVEIDDEGLGDEVARLAHLFDRFDELISDEDVEEIAADLDPDSSAAVLVFEHTWVNPLRDAIVDSGGVLAASFRVPRDVVDDVMAALETAS
jgi:hypothetical protein